jgi:hypothetical protein
MRGAITPLPHTPSWRGYQLKKSTGTTLPLPFTLNDRASSGFGFQTFFPNILGIYFYSFRYYNEILIPRSSLIFYDIYYLSFCIPLSL